MQRRKSAKPAVVMIRKHERIGDYSTTDFAVDHSKRYNLTVVHETVEQRRRRVDCMGLLAAVGGWQTATSAHVERYTATESRPNCSLLTSLLLSGMLRPLVKCSFYYLASYLGKRAKNEVLGVGHCNRKVWAKIRR